MIVEENKFHVYTLTIMSLQPYSVNTLSSKISLTLFTKILDNEDRDKLLRIHESHEPLKPYRFTLLFSRRSKPVYGTPNRPYTLYPGEMYTSQITIVSSNPPRIQLIETIRLGQKSFQILQLEYKTYTFKELVEKEPLTEVELLFKTPTLLSPKLCLPPNKRVETAFQTHRLYPQPCLLTRSLAFYWNKYAPEKYKYKKSYILSRLADIYMAEISHNIKPITVTYRRSNNIIKHRAFIGKITYKIIDETIAQQITPLLHLASLVGVGRSRSIGLGHVEVNRKLRNHAV